MVFGLRRHNLDRDEDRRQTDRRKSGRGGRRRGDRGRPWWQKGLVFAVLCAISRCWRYFRRK